MSEKIIIKNFGGIQTLNAEFKQLNIFIGQQASGKSITVKLVFYFKNLLADIIDNVLTDQDLRAFKQEQMNKFTVFFPKECWGKSPFNITYLIDDTISIDIHSDENNKLKLIFSKEITTTYQKLRKFYRKVSDDHDDNSDEFIITKTQQLMRRDIRQKVSEHFSKMSPNIDEIGTCNNFFIPAGRSFFANLQSNIFSFLSDNQTIDPFLIEFGAHYETFKRYYNNILHNMNKNRTDINDLIFEILGSSYSHDKKKDYLIHSDHRKVNLANASSGQQETLPLIIFIYILLLEKLVFRRNKITLFIEEPEAHLFPTAQNTITKLLARLCNSTKYDIQIFITTHSPYVLSSFNNLFLAGRIAQTKSEEVDKLIDQTEQLQISNAAIYSLHNKTNYNIVDKELELIDAAELDRISDTINDTFSQLLDIESEIAYDE